MQLFKSQGLLEPLRAATKTYRDGGFGRRYSRHYGRRGPAAFDLSMASNDDHGDFECEAERDILRLMADYDCVA